MCGIAGYLGVGDAGLLSRMAAAIVHRGPDSDGVYRGETVGLTMRRLAIIDVEGGQQPVASADGLLQLVFNGEIYNYRELKAAYLPQARFTTASDTEVVLKLYEALGEAAFAKLNGMFAFALWDGRKQLLYLVRDRLGIKPLYIHEGASRLTFASEIRALLCDPDLTPRLDENALNSYLTWQYVPGPSTLLKGVTKLPPGNFLRLGSDRVVAPIPFWEPRPEPGRSDPRDFEMILNAAVKRQMVADVPVGAFLSGGIDSSLVVALMRRHASGRLKTFTAGFQDPLLDESKWAQRVTRYLDLENTVVWLDESSIDDLPELARIIDEPVADRAALPTLLLARKAKRDVKVVLTGEGSDELFGGYPRYRLESWAQRFHRLPGRNVLRKLAPVLPRAIAKVVTSPSDPAFRREKWLANFDKDARARLLITPGAVSPPQLRDTSLTAQLLLDMQSWLVDNVLMKVDKTTMAASLEARVPFLDNEVIDWALGLHDNVKLRCETTKFVVKKGAASILPANLIHRPKQGFHTPTAVWFRTKRGADLLGDVLLGPDARTRDIFEAREVEDLIQRHVHGENLDQPLWNLALLELWLTAYRVN